MRWWRALTLWDLGSSLDEECLRWAKAAASPAANVGEPGNRIDVFSGISLAMLSAPTMAAGSLVSGLRRRSAAWTSVRAKRTAGKYPQPPRGGPGGEGCGSLSGVGTSMFGALNGGVVD